MPRRNITGEALPGTFSDENEDLHEMANLYPDSTGLPMTVWVSPRGNARHVISMRKCNDREQTRYQERLG